MDDDTRKTVLVAYQKRKQEEIEHPFLKEKVSIGILLCAGIADGVICAGIWTIIRLYMEVRGKRRPPEAFIGGEGIIVLPLKTFFRKFFLS